MDARLYLTSIALALLTWLPLASAAQTRSAAGAARLTGTVVAAGTGEPLAGADVRILETGAKTFTAPDGYFEFDGLTPGGHTVIASRSGYVTSAAGMNGPADRPAPTELTAGSPRHVEIRLVALGAISGRVIDDMGQPARGTRIRAIRRRATPSPNDREGAEVSLDDDGQFAIRGLDPGRYYVVADKRAARTDQRTTNTQSPLHRPGDPQASLTYYPGTAFPDQAVLIEVAAGHETNASFTLASDRLLRVSGVVLDARGEPARDYLLTVTATRAPQPRNPVSIGYRIDDGAFELMGVPPGEYAIEASKHRSRVTSFIDIAMLNSKPDERARATVQVTGDDVGNVTLRLSQGFTVSGRLIDPSGNQIELPGVPVSATYEGERSQQGLVITNADGTFTFERLFGRYSFRLQPSAHSSALALARVLAGSVDPTNDTVEIAQDTSIDLVVGPATKLKGIVQTRAARLMPGAWVVIFGENPASWSLPDSRLVRYARSSNAGEFEIAGLPAGRYYAAVPGGALAEESDSQTPFVDDFSTLVDGATTFTLLDGETKSLPVIVD